MSRRVNLAIVGVSGAVGEVALSILDQRDFPLNELYPIASERSAGNTVYYKNKLLRIENLADFDFSKADIAIFSAGAKISAQFAPLAAAAGCVVIDNTSQFRYEADVPLVVPEVNPQAIADYKSRHIIANPNCSTIQMVVALKPIYDAVGIERINVATYQAVSGSGKQAVSELARQTSELLNGRLIACEVYPYQIAFNVLPHIDDFQANGYTKEEMKMVWETQKIFADQHILVNPTAVRVPVFYGHSEALHIETKEKITADQARKLLRKANGVTVVDDPDKTLYPTPVVQATNHDSVYVGRIREDISHPRGLDLWVVADNIRKGAALNSIQIAEILVAEYLG